MADELIVSVVAFAVSLALAPLARSLALRLKIVDDPTPSGSLKIHTRAVPLLGGVVAVTSVFLALVFTGESFDIGVLIGTVLALIVGLADDIHPLSVWPRLLLLGVAGAVVSVALLPDWRVVPAMGIAVLMICTANGVNIVDGQDGLAGGLVVLSAVGLSLALPSDEGGMVALGFAVAGGTLGFLFWNRPPARLFLGNNGAYALGVLLGLLSGVLIMSRGWRGLFAAGAFLGIFAFEVVWSLLRRRRQNQPLTSGDRSHTYDLLAERLHGREKATLIFYAIGTVLTVLGLVITYA